MSRPRRKAALNAIALLLLFLTLLPPFLLWTSVSAARDPTPERLLPSASTVLQHMGADRINQDAAAIGCVITMATWMLFQMRQLVKDAKRGQPARFRSEPEMHLIAIILWSWPATMALRQYPILPMLPAAAEYTAFTALMLLSILMVLRTARTQYPDLTIAYIMTKPFRDARNGIAASRRRAATEEQEQRE